MPVDNDIYNQPGDLWWDENQPLNVIRTALNPVRMQYFADTFAATGVDPRGKVSIDIGCGGGLFAEEMARMGATAIGIDPSPNSLAAARAHAAESGLTIDYRLGVGEDLPVADASADIIYCLDVLEHVHDLDKVISETARVLKSGGLYLYDTINRTRASKLVMIKLCQDWGPTACMPHDLHDWQQFITPTELRDTLARHNLQHRGLTGMAPSVAPPTLLRLLRQLKKKHISYAEFGRKTAFTLTKDLRISCIGHATKNEQPAGESLAQKRLRPCGSG